MLGLAWYFLEYVYALVAGFPCCPWAGALAAWPLWIQAADVTGAYLLAGLWVTVILSLRHWCRPACVCTGLLLAALLLGYGAWRLHTTPLEDDPRGEDSVAVLFAEGNIDQNQKWVPAYQRRTVETYLRLTQAELARHPGEKPLIVWPETALPFNFDNNGILSALVRNLARQAQSPLLTGVPGFQYDAAGNMQVFNRALLLDPSGNTAGHYDKEHLVPFGEYVPEWLNWNFLADLLQEVGVYTPGRSAAPLVHEDLRLGMLICYEAVFPWLAQARVEHGANVLVDISNDGLVRPLAGGAPASVPRLPARRGTGALAAAGHQYRHLRHHRRPRPRNRPRGPVRRKYPLGACAPATGGHHLSQARALAAAGRRTALARHFLGHASPLTFNPSIVLMLQLSDLRARCQPLDQRFDNLWGRL